MDRTDNAGAEEGEAIIEYGTPDFMILRPGEFVRCAVTGDKIPLAELRYWSVDLQEAYRDAVVSAARLREVQPERRR
ncbi:MAG: DUF2093 domain-containing protein [Maricaulaceae bacterium]|nr:DUF2093 domain-containing protein [Maricaulaceae bacterium]